MEVKSTQELNVPDGTYAGTWGGYQVTFTNGVFKNLSFQVNFGVRTFGIPINIEVKNGVATFERRE